MEHIEKRTHERVEFFRLQHEHELLPLWVFKPADEVDAIAGLVMDVSAGGVQVLTYADEDLQATRYRMHLLSGEEEDATTLHHCEVRRIWFRPEGSLHSRSGFAIEGSADLMPMLIESLRNSDHHLLRCTLWPLD